MTAVTPQANDLPLRRPRARPLLPHRRPLPRPRPRRRPAPPRPPPDAALSDAEVLTLSVLPGGPVQRLRGQLRPRHDPPGLPGPLPRPALAPAGTTAGARPSSASSGRSSPASRRGSPRPPGGSSWTRRRSRASRSSAARPARGRSRRRPTTSARVAGSSSSGSGSTPTVSDEGAVVEFALALGRRGRARRSRRGCSRRSRRRPASGYVLGDNNYCGPGFREAASRHRAPRGDLAAAHRRRPGTGGCGCAPTAGGRRDRVRDARRPVQGRDDAGAEPARGVEPGRGEGAGLQPEPDASNALLGRPLLAVKSLYA